MLAGPKRAVSGPKRAAPVEPGHRGQLARLIRERPVFVNVTPCRNWCRNWGSFGVVRYRPILLEYIGDCGVFLREDGGLQMGALDAEQADISDP
jgi:hypothetical protein